MTRIAAWNDCYWLVTTGVRWPVLPATCVLTGDANILPRDRDCHVSERPLELVAARAPFRDRTDAGRVLSRSLMRYRRDRSVIVLGLPRGGMAVARAVADALDAPLGVIVARKVGVPGIEDVALGAIAEGSHRVVADSVTWYLGVPARVVEKLAERESAELERCVATYRAGLPTIRCTTARS